MPSISTRTTSPTFSSPSGNGWRTAPIAGGRAGGDDVAGLERERLGEVRDLLEAVEDHLAGVAVLAQLVVDVRPDAEVVRVAELVGR